MIKSHQKQQNRHTHPKGEVSSVALVIRVKPEVLNSHSNFSQVKFVQYQRWVQDTDENRAALRDYLIKSVFFTKTGIRNMRYLPCCNLFYHSSKIQKKSVPVHKDSWKVSKRLLTEDEREQIKGLVKPERKKYRGIGQNNLVKDLHPHLIELLRGFKLKRLDDFVKSLPRNDGCFEFPLIMPSLCIHCAEEKLNKGSRVERVLIRHDLISDVTQAKEEPRSPIYSQASDQGKLSPPSELIRSFQNSSNKKLKVNHMIESPVKPVLITRSGRKVKQTANIRDLFLDISGPTEGSLFDSWSQSSGKIQEVGSNHKKSSNPPQPVASQSLSGREQPKIRPFVVPHRSPSKGSDQVKEEHENSSKELSSDDNNTSNLQLGLQKSKIKEIKVTEFNSSIQINNPGNQTKTEKSYDFAGEPKSEQSPSRSSCRSSDENSPSNLGSKLWRIQMSELEVLRQLRIKKGKKQKKAQNEATESEEQAIEAEKYAKGVLQASVMKRRKAEKLAKEVENLDSRIKDLEGVINIESIESSD